jgi:hypothetical protein
MNCTTIQRRLLGSERPDQPSGEVRQHLAECPACRAWQSQLVQIEKQIPLLPAPPSNARERVLRKILEAPAPAARTHTPVRPMPRLAPLGVRIKERGLQKMALAFALAAALVVFAIGWWAWPHQDDSGLTARVVDSLQIRRTRLDQQLAILKTPGARVEALAELADQLHHEARDYLADGERLALVAQFYEQVVREDLLTHARQVEAPDRALLQGIATRLCDMESEASRLAVDRRPFPDTSAASMNVIAKAARASCLDLQKLVVGG